MLLALSFWLFVAALPPFRIGIWVDSESVLVAAQSLFAAVGVCLISLWFTRERLSCSRHTLVFTGFAIVSLFSGLWANNPIVHHLGAPLLGEGTVLFCGLSLLSFAFDNIAKRGLLDWSAVIASLCAGALVWLHHPQHGLGISPDWLPYVFGAFTAPMALWVFLLSPVGKQKTDAAFIFFAIFGYSASFLVLFISNNKTAWVAGIAGIGFWLITRKLKSGYWLQKYFCASIPVISLVAIYYLGNQPGYYSLESRKLAMQSYFAAWQDQPLTLIWGNGWGSYFENLQKQITALPVKFFANGAWQPSWDGIDRIDFHCMHFGLESLFSLGLVGLVLYLALIISLFSKSIYQKNSFNTFMFVMLFACLTSSWFTLVCVWPFFVLGFAVLNPYRYRIARAPLVIIWLSIATAVCGHAAVTYWQTATLYPASSNSIFCKFTHTKSLPSLDELKTPYNCQGFHLGHFVLNTLKKKNQLPFHKVANELNLAFTAYDSNSSLVLDVAMLHAMEYFTGNDAQKQQLWKKAADAVQLKAPKRSDLLIPYLNHLIESNQSAQAKIMIDTMFKRNPSDPFALWLEGIYRVRAGNVASGRSLMVGALEHGIENWIAVPPALKNYLRKKSLL